MPLQLLEELAGGARDVNAARDAAFPVFHALDDARRLAALGAIRALGGIHDLFAVGGFRDLGTYCHDESLLLSNVGAAFRASLRGMKVDGMMRKIRPDFCGDPLG